MIYCVKQTLSLTPPEVLLSEHYYRRLWLAVINVELPRRDRLDELADTFRDFGGVVVTPEGKPIELPLVDDAFGNDADMRWMGYYLRPDDTGEYPFSFSRKVERLQLLDLYFRIKHPQIARHFRK